MNTTDRKAAPPAFQFYARDFLASTSDMGAEEVGAYIRLLCYQWDKGAIPDDIPRIERIAGMATPSVRQWQTDGTAIAVPMADHPLRYVIERFPVGSDGMRRNLRLERTRAEQEAFRAKKATSGKLGAEARWQTDGNAIGSPMANGMAKGMAKGMANDGSPSPSPSPNNTPIPPEGASVVDDGFADFWRIYPRKDGRKKAQTAWRNLTKAKQQAAMADVPARSRTEAWTKDGGRFVPHATTYLHQERWTDPLAPQQQIYALPVQNPVPDVEAILREAAKPKESYEHPDRLNAHAEREVSRQGKIMGHEELGYALDAIANAEPDKERRKLIRQAANRAATNAAL